MPMPINKQSLKVFITAGSSQLKYELNIHFQIKRKVFLFISEKISQEKNIRSDKWKYNNKN